MSKLITRRKGLIGLGLAPLLASTIGELALADTPVRDAMSGSKTLRDRRAVVGLAPKTIGGVELFSEGPPNSVYAGMRMVAGDDYNDKTGNIAYHPVLRPDGTVDDARTNNLDQGGAGPSFKSTGAGHYVADSNSYGHNDANRGRPVSSWADAINVADGVLTLIGRGPTVAEKLLVVGQESLAPFLGDRRWQFMHPVILECRARVLTYGDVTGRSGGACFIWMDPANFGKGDAIELDFDQTAAQGTSSIGWYRWVKGLGKLSSYTQTQNTASPVPKLYDGKWHNPLIKTFSDWTRQEYWVDGKLARALTDQTYAFPGGQKKPYYMHTNLALGGTWQALEKVVMQLDWWRLWQPVTGEYRVPRRPSEIRYYDFGASMSRQLPSTLEQWGVATLVADRVAALPRATNTPRMNDNGGFYGAALPEGFNLDGNMLLTGIYDDQPGEMTFRRGGGNDGDVSEVDTIIDRVGPRILTADTINIVIGQPLADDGAGYDAYWDFPCGDLGPPVLTVTGALPSGLSMSQDPDARYKITGTPAAGGSVQFTVANQFGQVAGPKTVTFAAATPGSGVPVPLFPRFANLADAGLIASIDPDNYASLTLASGSAGAGGVVSAIAGADSTLYAAIQNTSARRPTSVVYRNRGALRFDRASTQWLDWSAAAGAYPFGDEFTIVAVFRNVSTNSPGMSVIDIGHAADSTTQKRATFRTGTTSVFVESGNNSLVQVISEKAVDTAQHVWFYRRRGNVRDDVTGDVVNSCLATITRDRGGNGTTESTGAPGFSGGALNPIDTITIGARTASSTQDLFADIMLFRLCLFNRYLFDFEMAEVASRFAGAYGIL